MSDRFCSNELCKHYNFIVGPHTTKMQVFKNAPSTLKEKFGMLDPADIETIGRQLFIKTFNGVEVQDYLCDICANAAKMWWND